MGDAGPIPADFIACACVTTGAAVLKIGAQVNALTGAVAKARGARTIAARANSSGAHVAACTTILRIGA